MRPLNALSVAPIAATAVLFACYSEDDYVDDFSTALCGYYSTCDQLDAFGFADEQACQDSVAENYDPTTQKCANFHASLAKDCVKGVDDLSCDAEFALPDACAHLCDE